MTGDFGYNSALGKQEVYEATVNVLIELGNNSDLYDLALDHVEKQASEVDILQNILDTRVKYGMGNERGDFYLPSVYQTIAISYSGIGSAVSKIEPEKDESGNVLRYHVFINAENFSSAESSVGIKVTVKMSGDGTGQSRNIYVNAPAVIKPDEDGFANYSVFSSAKYQTFSQLADYEKADSSAAGYSGISDPEATDRAARLALLPTSDLTSGYSTGFVIDTGKTTITNKTGDYILVRDAEYEGVKSLSFKVGNSSSASKSHQMAYELAQLLEWATSTEKKAIPFTVGSYTSENTKSNGKDYMNNTETAVVKEYLGSLKDKNGNAMFSSANLSGDSTTSLWNRATRKPDGDTHVIEDYTGITDSVKTLLANDPGLYFKYTEVMQWALNEKKFENAGGNSDAPNLGNSGTYDIAMGGNKTGVSSTLFNWDATDSEIDNGAKITVKRNGRYDYTWEDPDNSYWNYLKMSEIGKDWTGSKYNSTDYNSDGTDYISDKEAQVIIAFWWGSDSNSNKTNAKNFAKAFLKACTIPTYLNGEGSGLLISEIYKRYGENDSFTVGLIDNTPEISNMDNSSAGIDFYKNLTSFEVYGEITIETSSKDNTVKLPAFITSEAVNNCFNRVTNTDSEASDDAKLKTLVMQACANKSTAFDLSTISRLSYVTYLDFSYNEGISTLGDLLNVDIKKITYLDVFRVNVEDAFVEYVLRTIKSNNPEAKIYYADPNTGTNNGNHTEYTNTAETSDALRYLNELTKVDSPYLQLTKKSYTGTGASSTIQWYLKSGNPAFLVSDPGSDSITATINTAEEMNQLLSSYYYCKESFTGNNFGKTFTFNENTLYRLVYENSEYGFKAVDPDTCYLTSDSANEQDYSKGNSSEKSDYREEISTTTTGSATPVQEYDSAPEGSEEIFNNKNVSGYYLGYGSSASPSSDNPNTNSELGGSISSVIKVETKQTTITTYRYYFKTETVTVSSRNYYIQASQTEVINPIKSLSFERITNEYVEYSYISETTYSVYYYKPNQYATTKYQIIKPSSQDTTNSYLYCSVYSKNTTGGITTYIYDVTFQYYDKYGSGTGTNVSYDYIHSTNSYWKYTQGTTIVTKNTQSEMETYLKALTEKDRTNVVTYDKLTDTVQYSYVTLLSSANCDDAIQKAKSASTDFILYKYTGTPESSEYYEGGQSLTKSYTHGKGYLLKFSDSATNPWFSFTTYTIHTATDATNNMETILAEANKHIEDELFGNYYGNYYCYNGTTDTVNGRTYTNGSVYRLMLSEDGTQFVFDNNLGVKSTFVTLPIVKNNDNSSDPTSLFYNLYCAFMGNNSGKVQKGQIVYCSGYGETYASGLYELVYNETSQTYYFKSMGALGNVTQSENSFSLTPENGRGQDLQEITSTAPSRFKNIRLVGTSDKNYGGTGGSEEVIIVARVIEKKVTESGETVKTIYERPFKVTVSG